MFPARRYRQERNSGLEAADPLATRFTGQTEERPSPSVNSGTRGKRRGRQTGGSLVLGRWRTKSPQPGHRPLSAALGSSAQAHGDLCTGRERLPPPHSKSEDVSALRTLSRTSVAVYALLCLRTLPSCFSAAVRRPTGCDAAPLAHGRSGYFLILQIKRGEGTGYVPSPPCRRMCPWVTRLGRPCAELCGGHGNRTLSCAH